MSLVPDIVCALREVYDPEVGLNVVDLGLVYGLTESEGHVRVEMTMMNRICPLVKYITGMADAVIRQRVSGIEALQIDVVWDPPWSPAMVAEEEQRARLVHI